MWVLEKILLLVEDIVEVSVIKLIIVVVVGSLVLVNSVMKGLVFVDIFGYEVIVMIIIIDSRQKMIICSGRVLIVLGKMCCGLWVFVVMVFSSLMLVKEKIVIWKLVKKLVMLWGIKVVGLVRWLREVVMLFGEVQLVVIIQLLVLIRVIMVIILIRVNQNFVLLNIFIDSRLSRNRIVSMLRVGIYVDSFGNQYCIQFLQIIMLVIQVIIQFSQQVQLR